MTLAYGRKSENVTYYCTSTYCYLMHYVQLMYKIAYRYSVHGWLCVYQSERLRPWVYICANREYVSRRERSFESLDIPSTFIKSDVAYKFYKRTLYCRCGLVQPQYSPCAMALLLNVVEGPRYSPDATEYVGRERCCCFPVQTHTYRMRHKPHAAAESDLATPSTIVVFIQ